LAFKTETIGPIIKLLWTTFLKLKENETIIVGVFTHLDYIKCYL
jgi:hypothetical protein